MEWMNWCEVSLP